MEKAEKIKKQQSQLVIRVSGVIAVTLLVVLGIVPYVKQDGAAVVQLKGLRGLEEGAKDAPVTVEKLKELQKKVDELDQQVRVLKQREKDGIWMQVDPEGLKATQALQAATRELLAARYGKAEPYRLRMDLIFQESNPTTATQGATGSFVVELAPTSLIPHSVFTILEVARRWSKKKGAFHRRANHVLQAMVGDNTIKHLAFQEYSPEYPHKRGTVGYCGRPSGPCFYVSIQDNSRNHGPGSQGVKNPHEADALFGRVIEGLEDVIVGRVAQMPGMGFLPRPKHVFIDKVTILVPDGAGGYKEWKGIEVLE